MFLLNVEKPKAKSCLVITGNDEISVGRHVGKPQDGPQFKIFLSDMSSGVMDRKPNLMKALILQLEFVTPEYLKHLAQCIGANKTLPNFSLFRPKCSHRALTSLEPLNSRSSVFSGFLFVFKASLPTREILSELVLLGKGSISTEFTENSKKTVVAIGFKEDNVPEYAIKKDEVSMTNSQNQDLSQVSVVSSVYQAPTKPPVYSQHPHSLMLSSNTLTANPSANSLAPKPSLGIPRPSAQSLIARPSAQSLIARPSAQSLIAKPQFQKPAVPTQVTSNVDLLSSSAPPQHQSKQSLLPSKQSSIQSKQSLIPSKQSLIPSSQDVPEPKKQDIPAPQSLPIAPNSLLADKPAPRRRVLPPSFSQQDCKKPNLKASSQLQKPAIKQLDSSESQRDVSSQPISSLPPSQPIINTHPSQPVENKPPQPILEPKPTRKRRMPAAFFQSSKPPPKPSTSPPKPSSSSPPPQEQSPPSESIPDAERPSVPSPPSSIPSSSSPPSTDLPDLSDPAEAKPAPRKRRAAARPNPTISPSDAKSPIGYGESPSPPPDSPPLLTKKKGGRAKKVEVPKGALEEIVDPTPDEMKGNEASEADIAEFLASMSKSVLDDPNRNFLKSGEVVTYDARPYSEEDIKHQIDDLVWVTRYSKSPEGETPGFINIKPFVSTVYVQDPASIVKLDYEVQNDNDNNRHTFTHDPNKLDLRTAQPPSPEPLEFLSSMEQQELAETAARKRTAEEKKKKGKITDQILEDDDQDMFDLLKKPTKAARRAGKQPATASKAGALSPRRGKPIRDDISEAGSIKVVRRAAKTAPFKPPAIKKPRAAAVPKPKPKPRAKRQKTPTDDEYDDGAFDDFDMDDLSQITSRSRLRRK